MRYDLHFYSIRTTVPDHLSVLSKFMFWDCPWTRSSG